MPIFDITTNPAKPTATHDPEAILDYAWDFSDVIDAGDVIVNATFQTFLGSPSGFTTTGASLTLGLISSDGTKVWGWLSITDKTLVGSTIAGTCHYTTAGGRQDDRTLYFKIRER